MNRFILLTTLCIVVRRINSWQIPLPGGGRIQLDQAGVLRIQLQAQDDVPSFPPFDAQISSAALGSIQVRDTGTRKGYGAFCTKALVQHTFLGFYSGELIESREALDDLVNQGKTSMDYVISLDGGVTFLDGYELSNDRTQFSPVFLNHADTGSTGGAANCLRLLENQQVAFFTARAIASGEELCFDYGSNYWVGREGEIV